MITTIPRNPATEKQIAFLTSLLERQNRVYAQIDPDNAGEFALANREFIDDLRERRTILSKRDASIAIDRAQAWLTQHKVPVAVRVAEITEGLYLKDDEILKVKRSARGNLYAKRLIPGGTRGQFVYAPGVVRALTPADALTPERAAAWGKVQRIGHDGALRVYCACCGAELDTKESRERGIGPVCYVKHFGR